MAVSSSAGAVAGAAFSSGAFGIASAVGTAGTGTAISALSGAAATNASLAWLGGGTIASGGFGMLGGAVVVSGGTAAVAVAASFAVGYVSKKLRERERMRLIEGRTDSVERLLGARAQPDTWG